MYADASSSVTSASTSAAARSARRAPCRQRRGEVGRLVERDQVVAALLAVEARLGEPQPAVDLVERVVRPVAQPCARLGLTADRVDEREQIVVVDARAAAVIPARRELERGRAAELASRHRGEQPERCRPPGHASEIASERQLDLSARRRVRIALPASDALAQARRGDKQRLADLRLVDALREVAPWIGGGLPRGEGLERQQRCAQHEPAIRVRNGLGGAGGAASLHRRLTSSAAARFGSRSRTAGVPAAPPAPHRQGSSWRSDRSPARRGGRCPPW